MKNQKELNTEMEEMQVQMRLPKKHDYRQIQIEDDDVKNQSLD